MARRYKGKQYQQQTMGVYTASALLISLLLSLEIYCVAFILCTHIIVLKNDYLHSNVSPVNIIDIIH